MGDFVRLDSFASARLELSLLRKGQTGDGSVRAAAGGSAWVHELHGEWTAAGRDQHGAGRELAR
jgi:hypothetical protein